MIAEVSSTDLAQLGAIGVLVTAIVGAWASARIVGPNRRKVVEDTNTSATTRATVALEAVLDRYEADNVRLRSDVEDLEAKFDNCLRRLHTAERERDELAARIHRMVARFIEAGIDPPD